jgi:O-antigen ligase
LALAVYLGIIAATLFMFYIQDIKNGMAYSTLCIVLFAILLFFRCPGQWWRKSLVAISLMAILAVALYPHIQKNQTWRTLISDTKVGFQLDKYPQWKFAGHQGYPNNEFGTMVSITTYERAAWFKVGIKLALKTPLGYGLVEDSFKKMAKSNWPEVSSNLSHSHSGWLDLILAIGFPGFFCVLGAIAIVIRLSGQVINPWKSLVVGSLVANLMFWVTTEVSATVSFALLIFWICFAGGLTLIGGGRKECRLRKA